MPSNRRITFTTEAESDLQDIIQYGRESWGERQANRYADQIWDKLEILSQFPAIGRSRDALSPGLRSHPTGEHLIFYRFTNDELIVRRLLHGRQDIEAIRW